MLIDSQLTIFDIIREKYVLNTTKPIKLIELFAGYGSQALALKYLNIPFIHHKICEWAVPSIQAYKDLHFTDVDEDYTENLFEDQLDKILFEYGISSDYNKPMDLKQIQKRSFDWKRKVYNNIKTTHNLVNIMSVKGKDLDFNDNKNETIILTYSFPCQDLSLAGSRKGMSISQAEGELGTRSGLLWEVERILVERQRESLPLPNILLMENVPQVISKQNVDDFNKWQLRLEKLGYCNYHEILNAKDFGIPQNRERCFMISLLGNYNYTFPKTQELKLKLKDMLEDNVDEKFYLSQKMIDYISDNVGEEYNLKKYERTIKEIIDKDEIENGDYIDTYNTCKKDISGTITTRISEGNQIYVAELLDKNIFCDELLKEGKVQEGDVFNHSRNKNPIIYNDEISPVLTTRCDELGTVVSIPIKNNKKIKK